MKIITQNIGRLIAGCVIACCLISNAHGQASLTPEQRAERRAAALARAEEARQQLEEALALAIAESELRRQSRPQLTPEQQAVQQAAAAAKQEAQWREKIAVAPLRPLIPDGQESNPEKQQQSEAEFQALRDQAVRSEAEQPAKERALDVLAEILDTPREIQIDDGRKLILRGTFFPNMIWPSMLVIFAAFLITTQNRKSPKRA